MVDANYFTSAKSSFFLGCGYGFDRLMHKPVLNIYVPSEDMIIQTSHCLDPFERDRLLYDVIIGDTATEYFKKFGNDTTKFDVSENLIKWAKQYHAAARDSPQELSDLFETTPLTILSD
ncbi:MAG: hypothetical protein U9R08_01935 [Nanoarchaeota archaeon]|nr:hypothetical protein [Nanoarchaeota archaeon]